MRILSVRPSVCLSVKRVDCDKTVEKSVQIFIPCERLFSLVDYCNSVCLPRRRRSRTSCSMFKMLQHVWSQGPENTSVVCLSWCMMNFTGWLFISECSTSLLWQCTVVFATELHATSPTSVCQSLNFLVASICDLPDLINCQFSELRRSTFGTRAFSVAGPTVWNSLPDHVRDPAADSEQFSLNLKTYLFARYSKR